MDTATVRRAASVLAAGRVALGAAVLASPERVTARWLGERNASLPVVGDLARSLGVRDVALGVAVLATISDARVGPGMQLACAAADAVDAAATVIARRDLPSIGVLGTVLVASGAALAGVAFARVLSRAET